MEAKKIIITGGATRLGSAIAKSLAGYDIDITIHFGDLNSKNKKIDIKRDEPLCILIGPEGDFSIKEREIISKMKNIIPININKNILRSETAAIAMISIISYTLLS